MFDFTKRKLRKGEPRDIVWIDLEFENFDSIRIYKKDLGCFFMSNIQRHLSICSNAVVDQQVAERVFITILKEAASVAVTNRGRNEWNINLLDRTINSNCDIASIVITYNTGKPERIYVPWIGEDDHHNDGQYAAIEQDKYSKSGQEYLVIEIKR